MGRFRILVRLDGELMPTFDADKPSVDTLIDSCQSMRGRVFRFLPFPYVRGGSKRYLCSPLASEADPISWYKNACTIYVDSKNVRGIPKGYIRSTVLGHFHVRPMSRIDWSVGAFVWPSFVRLTQD